MYPGKMLEHDLLRSKELLESVKAQLSTSQAVLKSCCCKDVQSGVVQSTKVALERDLVQSKLVAESFRHLNNMLTSTNNILTTEVDGLKKDLAQSEEKLSRYTTTNHRIFVTLHNFVSKLYQGRVEILFQSLNAIQAEVRRVMDTSLSPV
ncbi:hypothetical protein GJ744_001789 [Endocarpon pusillum]|uniref:Uncharacterized protein n=1 Tax=Endocarpon pusillum TaxID=364733 RepID=A0A8H7A8S6_9EURO|nr:hypothetical protein GJ744_001789 [Endocarpon pusillum]